MHPLGRWPIAMQVQQLIIKANQLTKIKENSFQGLAHMMLGGTVIQMDACINI